MTDASTPVNNTNMPLLLLARAELLALIERLDMLSDSLSGSRDETDFLLEVRSFAKLRNCSM